MERRPPPPHRPRRRVAQALGGRDRTAQHRHSADHPVPVPRQQGPQPLAPARTRLTALRTSGRLRPCLALDLSPGLPAQAWLTGWPDQKPVRAGRVTHHRYAVWWSLPGRCRPLTAPRVGGNGLHAYARRHRPGTHLRDRKSSCRIPGTAAYSASMNSRREITDAPPRSTPRL